MIDFSLKQRIRNREVLLGKAVLTHSPALVEIIGSTGFDFVMIDTEHSPLGVDIDMAHLIRAAHSVGLPVIVRVPAVVDHLIQGALELGAEGILIPHLQSRADAEAAVRAVKFPPTGTRGYASAVRAARFGAGAGPDDYIARSNRDTLVIGLAEDAGFFERLDEILSVEGLDMIYFGAGDLALSMGLSPSAPAGLPQIKAASARLVEAASRHGVALMGRTSADPAEAADLVSRGYRTVLAGSDVVSFRMLCAKFVKDAKAAIGGA